LIPSNLLELLFVAPDSGVVPSFVQGFVLLANEVLWQQRAERRKVGRWMDDGWLGTYLVFRLLSLFFIFDFFLPPFQARWIELVDEPHKLEK
jgi:hypothetical protein